MLRFEPHLKAVKFLSCSDINLPWTVVDCPMLSVLIRMLIALLDLKVCVSLYWVPSKPVIKRISGFSEVMK